MWHTSQRFVALEHDFAVRAEDPRLVERIDWAYADLVRDGKPAGWYEIPGRAGFDYEVRWNGALVSNQLDAGRALAWAQWDANRRAALSVAGPVLHAGAVRARAGAVVIAGSSGAGKSTIVALLVRQGWGYLTDEAVAFDPRGRLLPYPKPLSLDSSSLVLLDLEARLPAPLEGETEDKRLVPASLLDGGPAVGDDTGVALVAFPERGPAPAGTVQLTPAEALYSLMGHRHVREPDTATSLERLAEVLENVPCYRIRGKGSREIAVSLTALA